MEEKCLSCKNKPVSCFSCCDFCERGICQDCNWNIRKEIKDNLSKTCCVHCTTDFDKFCEKCRKCIFRSLEAYKEHQKRGYYPQNVDINVNFVRKELYILECRCDIQCKCYKNVRMQVKKKYNVENWSTWEIYDKDISSSPLPVCTECLEKKGKPRWNEGLMVSILTKDLSESLF